jgi:formiminotetrahydrofolate cyclodeaminase
MAGQTRESLIELPVVEFLNRLASREPTPGGGAVAGLAGSLAVALARMVGAYSVGKKTSPEDRAFIEVMQQRLARLDGVMRRLIDEDAEAYAAFSALPRDDSDAQNVDARRAALERCVDVPLSICSTASDALTLFEELAPKAGRWILSDLEAAAILGEATIRCAGCSIRVNAAGLADASQAATVNASFAQIEQKGRRQLAAVLDILAARGGKGAV